ncbi:MAG: bifunctional hydroxymethylpyrimidine kinase/phosphomethylpyrimidine kinase [Brevinematales bacterium]|nr:bifunctional hydroxymethylpyrimidine kinase/phosphomethylpyrimidine kinase [Brevinematales bacterium]
MKGVLTIAGSDPSGGAGIQADLKTFATLGVYGAAVITALTAQNTTGVYGSVFLDPAFVRLQIRTVLEDIPFRVFKTGMLGNASLVRAVAESLPQDGVLVCDPVMYAKSGYPLLEKKAIETMKEYLFPLATVMTPNYPELSELLGKAFDPHHPEENGKRLLSFYPSLQAVVVKGGHREVKEGKIEDVIVYRQGGHILTRVVSHPYISTPSTHGTGCTLASAIAAYVARGEELVSAIEKATAYVHFLLTQTKEESYGRGHGPLPHHRYKENI